jgi:haloalkane dehalogenase
VELYLARGHNRPAGPLPLHRARLPRLRPVHCPARLRIPTAGPRVLGGPIGGYLIKHRNFFVETIIPAGTKRVGPDERVMEHYRGPFPTPQSRIPMHVFPRAIIGETEWLAEVEKGLASLDDHPALILWPTKDQAFGDKERERWEQTFTDHRTIALEGAGHYIGEDAPQDMVSALTEWQSRQG